LGATEPAGVKKIGKVKYADVENVGVETSTRYWHDSAGVETVAAL